VLLCLVPCLPVCLSVYVFVCAHQAHSQGRFGRFHCTPLPSSAGTRMHCIKIAKVKITRCDFQAQNASAAGALPYSTGGACSVPPYPVGGLMEGSLATARHVESNPAF